MSDRIERLERLAGLHQSGALSEAEFGREKASVLAEMAPRSSAAAAPSIDITSPPTAPKASVGIASPRQPAGDPSLLSPDAGAARAQQQRRWGKFIGVTLVAVLLVAAASLATWWFIIPRGIVEAPTEKLPPAVGNQAAPAAPADDPIASDMAYAQQVASSNQAAGQTNDSDADDEVEGDAAYYAAAEPFMRLPLRVTGNGHDYCCLTMGMIYSSLEPNDLSFKRFGKDEVTLTSTDLSARPWRMITYDFRLADGHWRLRSITDSAGIDIDETSSVSPDQTMIEQFKLSQQP